MGIEIGDDADEWKKLSFERCLPSIRTRTVEARQIRAVVRVSEKHVSGRNLGGCNSRKNEAARKSTKDKNHVAHENLTEGESAC